MQQQSPSALNAGTPVDAGTDQEFQSSSDAATITTEDILAAIGAD